jgi:hypothetical protein
MGGDGALWQLFFCIGCVATEPPSSVDTSAGDEGAVAYARALEKNSSLLKLNLNREFVCCSLMMKNVDDGVDILFRYVVSFVMSPV